MDPTEFINHRDTVFHASYTPLPAAGTDYTKYGSGHAGIHAGTIDSAEERVARGLGPKRDGSGDPATVYALHVPPERFINGVDSLVSDYHANHSPDLHDNAQGTEVAAYYRNEVEDQNSTSVVLNNRHKALTHSDYVRDAIANGKEHEVHPLTLAMYHAGSLDKLAPIDYTKVRKTKEPFYNPERDKLEQHEGGLFPYAYMTPMSFNPSEDKDPIPVSREELNKTSGGNQYSLNEMYKDYGSGHMAAQINAQFNDVSPEAKQFVDRTKILMRVAPAPAPKRRELGDVTRNRSTKPVKKAPPAKYTPKNSAPPAP
jgi:hypothetical protein